MISVEEALQLVFALVTPLTSEKCALRTASGRVMTAPAVARRDQPPFDASAMDGYAIPEGAARRGASFTVIGEAPAGRSFAGRVGAGQAVRIFTGAALPEGAGHVVIQENVERVGDRITLSHDTGDSRNIRPCGQDFRTGESLPAPRRLRPADLGLLAAMNVAQVTVARRPTVAIIATGDELVMPGEKPSADQIIASNSFALAALAEAEGATARLLPIARDTEADLRAALELAADADVIVTIGGASVGDHDLVAPVTQAMGASRAFYKVALRPGKPLMAGRLGGAILLGLPGNPVSAVVCAHLFLLPVLRALQGLPAAGAPELTAPLGCDLPANGPRAHYQRATVRNGIITPANRQDSALIRVLAAANALLIQPAGDGPRHKGEQVPYIAI
ncbi:molybdopterin molybdotransferase MoeA [Roseicitreum antarcticum]|uniref:Molybdopterin molybdenumtransferase n=1 Tax=Roseicitreum antarcticum TaxID=564137 RepID=A0A1H3BFE3_9RHOB|nr:molybdopterin molybdotransferase MoeA [Roseicitreum antarcticum]SDX40391.1 molybdopterin molybdochelatase [Roseicitreum antarcticum]